MSFTLIVIIFSATVMLHVLIARNILVTAKNYFEKQLKDEALNDAESVHWYLKHLYARIQSNNNKAGVLIVVIILAILSAANNLDWQVDILGMRFWGSSAVIVFSWWRYESMRYAFKTVDEKLKEDKRPPVLYLRSFAIDADAPIDYTQVGFLKGKPLSSFEQKAVHFARYLGPVIAIAAPGRPVDEMPVTSKQHYGADWQQHILKFMEKSSLIIMRPYNGEGVLWEFEQLVKRGYLNKTILYMHRGIKRYNQNKAALEDFTSKVLERWNIEIGELNDQKPFVYFDDNLAAWETDDEFDIPIFRKVFNNQYIGMLPS